eukprot:superscaffoldBa00001776_g11976
MNSASDCQYINSLASWFDDSFLNLNVTKTKELCLGGNRRQEPAGRCGGKLPPVREGFPCKSAVRTQQQNNTTT